MTPERNLHYTLIQYFDSEDTRELHNILKHSKITYRKEWEFTAVPDQRNLTINIKTPLSYKRLLEQDPHSLKLLRDACFEIYEDDADYAATRVELSILATSVTSVEIDQIEREIVADSVYQNFILDIANMNLDTIEKSYLMEACECASRNNILAASTMLGCAAEYLLLNMCNAYLKYLRNNDTKATEADIFERKVINAKCAYNRLDEFLKRVISNGPLFQSFDFENPQLNFNFLDIIRKIRNDAGHPTGQIISKEELQMMFGTYQHFIKSAHRLINELPLLTPPN